MSFQTGTLTNGTPLAVNVANNPTPMTATLDSAAAGRLIELSSDGGTNYFTPTLDAVTTPMVNVSILSPISHVRFTGESGDIWSVR